MLHQLRTPLVGLLFCFAAPAFQNAKVESTTVSIIPRIPIGAPEFPSNERPAHLRVDSALVQIPVNVTTAFGAPVTDLTKDDFVIYEDGVEQQITHFAKDDAPIS